MSSELTNGRTEHAQACANSGLESLAAEASRRAESMERDLDAQTDRTETNENDIKSPSRSSGPRGKVRKAYTITKQRERWTEEEHERFLQALKRYGRAWRKIEEHIGTKTAVQIRSHAQKFFSKLQREQSLNGGREESSKNDISIPPPRPKRKPMHPYPRNSVDSSSGDHDQQPKPAPKPHPCKDPCKESQATTSTQLPVSTPQYSNSSGYQAAQPVLPHLPLFPGHPSPFSGVSVAQQPTHVQLPPFPSLDTSSGENITKVLKDAALAAASAWNQVIAGASQKVQHQIQAQSFQPQTAPSLPVWNQYQDATGQNPFMPQLMAHAAAQQSASQQFLGQRYKHMYEADKAGEGESEQESLGSEEKIQARSNGLDISAKGGIPYWSSTRPHSLAEAKLGRTAWEMMNRATAQKPQEAAKLDDAQATPSMKAPSTGESGAPRRIMKPVPHSAMISPLHDPNPSLHSGVCSDTSQLAHFYQRAAAAPAAERDPRPEAYGKGLSGNGDHGSSGDNENGSSALYRKSDKGSTDGNGSDEANGNLVKDNASNGSNERACPGPKDLGQSQLEGIKREKNSGDNLLSSFAAPIKCNVRGSDKASNTGSGSDEDGTANASDLTAAHGDEKGSNEGSNSGRASPREDSHLKDGSQSANRVGLEHQKARPTTYPRAGDPHSAEAAWVASSLQNQQQSLQMGFKQGRLGQAELMQRILPFTLTPQQQQAVTTWAAANTQSQPHQFHMMQSLLAGLASPNSEYMPMGGNGAMERQISSLTSADTGCNTDCNTAVLGGFGLSPRASAPVEVLCKRASGFQPYSKRPADSVLAAPTAKRFAPCRIGEDLSPKREYTPFGNPTVQSEQIRS